MKTEYYPKLLTPETRKLRGNNKSKITKEKNGANMPNLEITEVVLVHCNIFTNDYQQDNKSFRQLVDSSFKSFIFLKNI